MNKFFLKRRIKKEIRNKSRVKKDQLYRYSQARVGIEKLEKFKKTYPRTAASFTSRQIMSLEKVRVKSARKVRELNREINSLKGNL